MLGSEQGRNVVPVGCDRAAYSGSTRSLMRRSSYRLTANATSPRCLRRLTSKELGASEREAWPVEDGPGELASVSNVCDTDSTMVGKVAKLLLGRAAAYGGVHDRLRAVGAEHLPGGAGALTRDSSP